MGQCRFCGKKGLFLSVSPQGLCGICQSVAAVEVQQCGRIITESLEIINKSTNAKTRISRCDVVCQKAEALVKYEEKGIPTMDPAPSQLIRDIQEERDNIIFSGAEAEVDKALSKAELAATPRTQVSTANKVLLKLREYRDEMREPSRLGSLETQVKRFVHKTQLDAFLGAARKAEFKGNKKKALDQYQEALYFLKTDDIDDALQQEAIGEIENKIAELTGEKGEGA